MKQINLSNIDWQKIILYTVILVLISLLFTKCEQNKTALANIDALNSKMLTYKLRNGQLVSSVKTLQMSLSDIKKTTPLTKEFTKIKTVTKIVERFHIDTIEVVYTDSIPCEFERKGLVLNKDYQFLYKSNQKGFKVENMIISDSITMVSGTKRKWFLGKETQTFDITHSNHYIQTESAQHIEVIPKKRFYDTTLFKVGIGFIGGFLIAK
jgi:hypothetical protein